MNAPDSSRVDGGVETVASTHDQTLGQDLLSQVRARYPNSDIHSILNSEPELRESRSVVVALAADEFEGRLASGEKLSVQDYCRPFLRYGRPLYSLVFRQIEFENFLAAHVQSHLGQKKNAWPEIGDIVADFRVLEEIGRGALARVYLCCQTDLGDRQVVVKVSTCGDLEANALAKIQHPHIMPVHSIKVDDDQSQTYLCTPFLGRSTLADLLLTAFTDKKPRSIDTIYHASNKWNRKTDKVAALRSPGNKTYKGSYVDGVVDIAIKLTSALEHAHVLGVLHGDLKPSNVLLTSEAEPILLDFNLSPSVALEARGGTIPYMAPEQILSLTDFEREFEYDRRSEIFSLGVMLYELISGQLPYESVDIEQLEKLKSSQLRSSLEKIQPLTTCGSGLAAVVERCLAFDPDERFSSMGRLRERLLQEKRFKNRVKRRCHQHRRAILTAVAFIGIALTGLIAWLVLRPPYHDRQHARGIELYRSGKYHEAFLCFERASASEGSIDSRYAAAQSALQSGDAGEAMDLFLDLALVEKHPPSMASAAYCFSLKNSHSSAIPWYNRAIKAGYGPAAVYCNLSLGYDLGRSTHSESERLQLGIECAKKSLKLDPELSQAHLNLAHLALKRHLNDSQFPVGEGIAHVRKFIESYPNVKEAYILSACLYGARSQQDPTAIDAAIDLLIEGCQLHIGITLKSITDSPYGNSFQSHSRYAALKQAIEHQTNPKNQSSFRRLVDPAYPLANKKN